MGIKPNISTLVLVHDSSHDRTQIHLNKVVVADRNLRKALGQSIDDTLLDRLARGSAMEMPEDRLDHLQEIMNGLKLLLDLAMLKLGKVSVRFIHDLKSTDYPTDVQFFHLTDTSTQEDMSNLIRGAMAKPGKDGVARLCNMRNVRDVEIKLRSTELSDVHHDYAALYDFHQAVLSVLELPNPDYMLE